jgi:hypothetical protein
LSATKTAPDETQVDETQVLDLTTLAPVRPTVNIRTSDHPEGKQYELRIMDDFGIEDQQQLTREGAEFDKLWNTDKLNGKQSKRLKMLLDNMFDRVLDAPSEIRAQLRDGQRSQVVLAFTLAPLAAAAQRQQETQARETGSTTES